MFIENEFYKVRISKDETFTLNSTDNKPYDYVFNPSDMSRHDYLYIKTLSISIAYANKNKNIALIGSMYGAVQDIAILEKSDLIILMNTTLTCIDCQNLSLKFHKAIADGGIYYSIYKYDNGFVVFGELDIIKLSYAFDKEWSFSGADIFVTQDGSSPFSIENDIIHLSDWNGRHYLVDGFGKEITNRQ